MGWLIAIIIVVALGVAAAAAVGGMGEMAKDPVRDRYAQTLPERLLNTTDLDTIRFGIALRGYAMDQVDDLLDRIGYELYERDQLIAELTGTDAATAIALRRQGVQVGQPSQLLPVDEQPAHEQPAPPAPLDEPAEA